MMNQAILPHYRISVQKQQSVGVASAPMTTLVAGDALAASENIFVQALSTNTSPIMISVVNPAVAGGVGYELPPGSNMSLSSCNASDYFVISGAAAQKLNITYQAGIV